MEPSTVTPDPAITAIEEVQAPIRKFYVAETKALRNGDVEAYISTESVDRMGDIIKAKGWELGAYRKTGSPVLFGHEYGVTPGGGIAHIGNAVEMEIQRKGLWSVTRFHEKTQLSREAAILAREKLMPGWSVGFSPLDKPEDRMVDGVWKGFIFNRQELLEYSLVSVPANPEAVSKAADMARRGLIGADMINRINAAAIFAGPSPTGDEGIRQDEQAIVEQFRKRHEEHFIAAGFTKR